MSRMITPQNSKVSPDGLFLLYVGADGDSDYASAGFVNIECAYRDSPAAAWNDTAHTQWLGAPWGGRPWDTASPFTLYPYQDLAAWARGVVAGNQVDINNRLDMAYGVVPDPSVDLGLADPLPAWPCTWEQIQTWFLANTRFVARQGRGYSLVFGKEVAAPVPGPTPPAGNFPATCKRIHWCTDRMFFNGAATEVGLAEYHDGSKALVARIRGAVDWEPLPLAPNLPRESD